MRETVHEGTGPYPHPCQLCGQPIEDGEAYVIDADGLVAHLACAFLTDETPTA